MSGVEVAGLALAILPLMVSAVDHYDRLLDSFRTYRCFSSKVKRLTDDLNIQRTIFRTECLLLLAPITTRASAQSMLDDLRNEKWNSVAIDLKLSQHFDYLNATCKIVIAQVIEHLKIVSTKISQLTAADNVGSKGLGVRLKFSISGSGLKQCMTDLTKSNEAFRTLSAQIDRLKQREVSAQQDKPQGGDALAKSAKARRLPSAYSKLLVMLAVNILHTKQGSRCRSSVTSTTTTLRTSEH